MYKYIEALKWKGEVKSVYCSTKAGLNLTSVKLRGEIKVNTDVKRYIDSSEIGSYTIKEE